MASNKPVIHADDHRRVGALGPNDPGGADPIDLMLPTGLLAGYGGVDLAVTNPGGLVLRYQLGEPSGAALDTSGFSGTSYPLTYTEFTSGVDPVNSDVWVSGNAATRDVVDHTSFESADDGSVVFNYKQLHSIPAVGGPFTFPGALFTRGSMTSDYTVFAPSSGTGIKSVSAFFKATSGGVVPGAIVGSALYSGVYTAAIGWRMYYTPSSNILTFAVVNSGGAGGVTLNTPGALTPGQWYHCAVTYNTTSHVWIMYLNGVQVATATATASSAGSSLMEIGASVMSANFGGDFCYGHFYGEVDEVDIYNVTLTSADVQAIYAARGSGFQTTVTTTTIGTGTPGPAFPGAMSSQLPDGSNSAAHQVFASDGAGGSLMEWPTHGVYVSGA